MNLKKKKHAFIGGLSGGIVGGLAGSFGLEILNAVLFGVVLFIVIEAILLLRKKYRSKSKLKVIK